MTPKHHINAVMAAIRDAERDGLVSSNRVRPLIPEWVPPTSVGRVYSMLRRQGILEQDGYETSTDEKGRNAGKLVPVYRLRKPLTIAETVDAPTPKRAKTPAAPAHDHWGRCATCHAWCIRYGPLGSPLCASCAEERAA